MINLIVVLDPNYGNRLGKVAQFTPVWVVATPGNNDACQQLWKTSPVSDHREKGAITSDKFAATTSRSPMVSFSK